MVSLGDRAGARVKELRGIAYAVALMAVVAFGFRLIALAQAPTTDWSGIGSFIQGVVAIVAAVLTYRALRVAAHSAHAAEVAANAAFESSESLKRAERAYLDFSFEAFEREEDGGCRAKIVAFNDGKTPARVFQGFSEVEPSYRGETLDAFVSKLSLQNTTIGPGARIGIQEGRARVGGTYVIKAVLDYKLVFGGDARSTICARYRITETGVDLEDYFGGPEWNSMD
jgi:hypothetical protein